MYYTLPENKFLFRLLACGYPITNDCCITIVTMQNNFSDFNLQLFFAVQLNIQVKQRNV